MLNFDKIAGEHNKNASQDADSLAGRWPKFSQW